MALTNFGLLTDEQKTIWSMDMWKTARNVSFIGKFLGTGSNSMIQKIDELKKNEKGARAVITLLTDLEGDGVAGDRNLEGNEEAMRSFDQVIRIDQLRHAVRLEGRMADQKSIVNFRQNARDQLAYWLAERMDQMAFLTMSGVSYNMKNNGAPRGRSDLPQLEFAADVAAPTDARRARYDAANKRLVVGGTSSQVMAADTPTWDLFVQLKAYAKDQYMRGLKGNGGEETYHAFLTPQAMMRLKLDPLFMQNVRSAQVRSGGNPLFTGSSVMIDGIIFHEYRNVYNTAGAAAGQKWGAAGNVDGCQILFCGAQALAMADLGNPDWTEKEFDYDNQIGIATAKILGFLKPQFNSMYSNNTKQDFGVISVYTAQ